MSKLRDNIISMLTRILVLIIVLGLPTLGYSQARSIELYPYNYTSISPAFAGVDGTKFTFIGNMVTFGTDSYPFVFFAGAETSYKNVGFGITALRRRAGFATSGDYALPVNYQWKINDKNKLVFGARVSYQRAELNPVLTWLNIMPGFDPDRNQRKVTSMANLSLGSLYQGELLYIGFSVDNILTKESTNDYGAFPTKMNLIVGKDVKGKKISSMHSMYASINNDYWTLDINNSVVFKDLIIAGFSIELSDLDEGVIPKVNAGVKFGDYGKAVAMLYSSSNDDGDPKFRGQLFLMFTLPAIQ